MSINFIVTVSALCAAITFALCHFADPIGARLDILDVPDARKAHPRPTPLIGGIALQIAVVPLAFLVALIVTPDNWIQYLLVWTSAVGAMSLVGLADDRHTLLARDRLLVSFIVFGSAAIIDPLFNVRVLSFQYPPFELGLGTGWLAVLFTTICCVGLVNAVNMADGKNGLVIGLCLGWLAILGLSAPTPLLPIIAIAMTMLAVLLVYNLRGVLFLGDGGAYGVATAIALIAIGTYNSPGYPTGRAISAGELVLLFSIPVFDSFRLTLARLRQGRSPMSADRNHLHHHLQSWFGWPGGLVIYWTIALGPSTIWHLAMRG